MYNELHSGNYHAESEKYAHLKIKETEEENIRHKEDYAKKKMKTPIFKGIDAFLKDLHLEGHLLVINTHDYSRNCLPLLEHFGIKDFFDFVATANYPKTKLRNLK